MFGIMGDPPKRAGRIMPPATTRRLPERPAASTRDARIVPPFIPTGSPSPAPRADVEVALPLVALEPALPIAEPVAAPGDDVVEPPQTEDTFAAAEDVHSEPGDDKEQLDPWKAVPDGEGIVEPAFHDDTDGVLLELMQETAEAEQKEEFPLDAFILPEETQHVPTGLEGAPATPPPEATPANALAERLEKLSHRLRVEDSESLVRRLAGGDRTDALLAGLLAGYLAGKSEQP